MTKGACWGVVAFAEAQGICLSFYGSEEEIRIGSEDSKSGKLASYLWEQGGDQNWK